MLMDLKLFFISINPPYHNVISFALAISTSRLILLEADAGEIIRVLVSSLLEIAW